jgi:lipoprotein-anchoring transpeptidase ErfK/SrfK/predicted negative regulator of RcsB-dependent stress response
MTKKRFQKKRSQDNGLLKIILAICILLAAGYGVSRMWGGSGAPADEVAALVYTELDRVESLMSQGKPAEARAVLDNLQENKDPALATPQGLMLRAQVAAAEGQDQEVVSALQQLLNDYPDSALRADAQVRLADTLQKTGSTEEAGQIYSEVARNTPPEIRAAAVVGLGREALNQGDPIAARNQFQQAMRDASFGTAAYEEALDALGALNVQLIFTPGETPESKVYEVESGDSLTSIGIKLNTTLGLLMRANNITDPSRLHLGQRLKWTPKDFRIIIDRTNCTLYLFDKDGIFKRYRVGLGMPGYETTPGKYKIGNKQKDPTWHKPGSTPIPPGDPANELGTRWMPLVPVEEGLPTDLGIHGTIAPDTIGFHSSHGCARMMPADVEELYDLVVRSTPVTIVEEFKPEAYLVAEAE